MKLIMVLSLALAGCATYSEMLVNASGEARQCTATGQGIFGMETAKNATKSCVADLRSVGYLPIDEAGAIGVQMNGREVVRVSPGHPADNAGIEAGDVIVEVEGEATRDETVRALMWGKAGEAMNIVVSRGDERIAMRLVRTTSRAVNAQ